MQSQGRAEHFYSSSMDSSASNCSADSFVYTTTSSPAITSISPSTMLLPYSLHGSTLDSVVYDMKDQQQLHLEQSPKLFQQQWFRKQQQQLQEGFQSPKQQQQRLVQQYNPQLQSVEHYSDSPTIVK